MDTDHRVVLSEAEQLRYERFQRDSQQFTEEEYLDQLQQLNTRIASARTAVEERAVEGEGAETRGGYGRAATALRNENYRVEKLLLAAAGDVPEDADAVILPGPTRPLLDVEYVALDRYLARGGAVLAMVDPRVRGGIGRRTDRGSRSGVC